jgi:hypothetical protein
MKNFGLIIFVSFFSTFIKCQNLEKCNFLELPKNISIHSLKIMDTLNSDASFSMLGNNNKHIHFQLICLFKDVRFAIDWYENDADNNIFVKERQLEVLNLIKKSNFNDRKVDLEIIKDNLQFKDFGIKKLNFDSIQKGTYTDKWFNNKRIDFIMRYTLVDMKYRYPFGYENEKFINYKTFSPKSSEHLKLVIEFESTVSGTPPSIEMRRFIYIDVNTFDVLSCELLSQIQFKHYDRFY